MTGGKTYNRHQMRLAIISGEKPTIWEGRTALIKAPNERERGPLKEGSSAAADEITRFMAQMQKMQLNDLSELWEGISGGLAAWKTAAFLQRSMPDRMVVGLSQSKSVGGTLAGNL